MYGILLRFYTSQKILCSMHTSYILFYLLGLLKKNNKFTNLFGVNAVFRNRKPYFLYGGFCYFEQVKDWKNDFFTAIF